VDLLASITTAAAAIDLFGGLLFVVSVAHGAKDGDQKLLAPLCLAAGVHALLSVAAAHGGTPHIALVGSSGGGFAWLGLTAALPLAVHFAIRYGGMGAPPRTIAAIYLAAFGCASYDVFGETQGAADAAPRATYCAAVLAAAVLLVMVARAYLAGRREALALVMGATILLATIANDAGIVVGAFTTGPLIDAGLAAFVASIMSTRSIRFAAVTVELERRTQELRTRTRELGRSYEELRAAQEELVKKEQLAVVGELAAVIAHEVRNPLAIIANAVSGLRKQVISRDDHETLLAILEEETSRLNRLVTDLLRYARPVNVQRTDFSLSDVLVRALGLVSKDRKSIKADFKIEGHDGRIWGDANLLRQVFDNLVVNAMQAMGMAGVLTVRVRAANQDGTDGVAVDIIDTGEGMDTQVRSRARDPFFTTRPSGTGLGLAIVDRIVDAHGGRLSIESRTGEGTTVSVFLPHLSPNEPAYPRPRPRSMVATKTGREVAR
jgi:signal transduction histidine kinase